MPNSWASVDDYEVQIQLAQSRNMRYILETSFIEWIYIYLTENGRIVIGKKPW